MSTSIIPNMDNPYDQLIRDFFTLEFPAAMSIDPSTELEGVMLSILATGNIRYGPKPNPESVVAIRDVVRKAISEWRPIPMLSPFGSRKSVLGEGMDVAEIFALKQLSCLQQRVVEIYKPGIQVNIRLEDASGHYLFADEGQAFRDDASNYCFYFPRLVNTLGLSSFVKPVLESSIFSEDTLTKKADSILMVLIDYMIWSDLYGIENRENCSAFRLLKEMGWKGDIPLIQRNYYRDRYKSLYPNLTDYEATVKLARYFAQAWARVQLNGTGADDRWGSDYIRLTFINPIPGLAPSMTAKDVYYRTVPRKFTEYHMPPWRTKGYLQIDEEGAITPKIASWKEEKDYQKNYLTFSEGIYSAVTVRADYLLV